MSCTHSLYLCVHFCVCRVTNTVKPSRCELSQGARRLARLPPVQMQTLPIFAKCFLILVWSCTRATFEQLIILCDLHAFIRTLCPYHGTKAPEHLAARVPCAWPFSAVCDPPGRVARCALVQCDGQHEHRVVILQQEMRFQRDKAVVQPPCPDPGVTSKERVLRTRVACLRTLPLRVLMK